VCVYNNKGGLDGKTLKAYCEPSWNNPVVRFVDGTGSDIVARRDGIYTASGIARRMVDVLNIYGVKPSSELVHLASA